MEKERLVMESNERKEEAIQREEEMLREELKEKEMLEDY